MESFCEVKIVLLMKLDQEVSHLYSIHKILCDCLYLFIVNRVDIRSRNKCLHSWDLDTF